MHHGLKIIGTVIRVKLVFRLFLEEIPQILRHSVNFDIEEIISICSDVFVIQAHHVTQFVKVQSILVKEANREEYHLPNSI